MNKFTTNEAKLAAIEFTEVKKRLAANWKLVGFYEYQDINSNPIYWRIRLDPPNNSNDDKWIRPFLFDGRDWALKGRANLFIRGSWQDYSKICKDISLPQTENPVKEDTIY